MHQPSKSEQSYKRREKERKTVDPISTRLYSFCLVVKTKGVAYFKVYWSLISQYFNVILIFNKHQNLVFMKLN